LTPARKKGEIRTTKTGRSRSFPIHRELEKVLKTLAPAADGLLFHGPKGGRLKPDTVRIVLVRDVLKPLAKRFPSPPQGAGFRDGRLHSFRHAFCSACANGGVPEPAVRAWLGHADSEMIRVYYHLHNDEAQRQMDRLDFFGVGGNSAADAVSKVLE
jgi:integrase